VNISNLDLLVKSQFVDKFRGEGRESIQSESAKKRSPHGKEVLAENNSNVSKEILEQAVEQANQTMEIYRVNLHFKIHEESGEFLIQVINSQTKEVIREIPPEWILDRVAYFKKMIGVIIDEII